jgi:hypothetical protein
MTQLSQKLAEIRQRLAETVDQERQLVRGLNAALNQADELLIGEIRHITAQHEARRGAIVAELNELASRVCAFPLRPAEAEALHQLHEDALAAEDRGRIQHAPGNWRLAAQNIGDDLDFETDVPTASH